MTCSSEKETIKAMPSKQERRNRAREVARKERERERRRTLRNRVLTQGGIGVALIAVIALAVFVVTTGGTDSSTRPPNTAHDAINLIGDEGRIAAQVASPNIETERSADAPNVIDIVVYADYLCPFCAQFESANGSQIMQWVAEGKARLEYHPIAFLDRLSQGSNYSTRAANAAACVADVAPDAIPAFNDLLFANQPAEGSSGLSDSQLIAYAQQAGSDDVTDCVEDQRYAGWVADATERSTTGQNVPEDAIPKNVTSTPTVFVDGQNYGDYLSATRFPLTDSDAFVSFVREHGDVSID